MRKDRSKDDFAIVWTTIEPENGESNGKENGNYLDGSYKDYYKDPPSFTIFHSLRTNIETL